MKAIRKQRNTGILANIAGGDIDILAASSESKTKSRAVVEQHRGKNNAGYI